MYEAIAEALSAAPGGAWRMAGLSALPPRPRLAMSEWAEAHVHLADGPERGRLRMSRAPFMREVYDAVSDLTVERIVVVAPAQFGKSTLFAATIGYHADRDPTALLLVEASADLARNFSRERLGPLFEASPKLRPLLSQPERKRDATVLVRMFPGGLIAMAWASSVSSLASRPCQVVMLDEVDLYPAEVGQSDPVALAIARTASFGHKRKILAVSTPTTEDSSRIGRMYADTDRRVFETPCLTCGTMQVLRWESLVYKNAAGQVDLDDVHVVCEAGCRIDERDKPEMLRRGSWRATNPGHPARGFHIGGLLSPFTSWRALVEEWVPAAAARDAHAMRSFFNMRLGEQWKESAARISVESLEKNRIEYAAQVPDDVLVLTAGADVQSNRIEVVVVGWGRDKASWGVQYAVIPGDTTQPATWNQLDGFLSRSWAKADGNGMAISCAFIDAGFNTDEVFDFCRARSFRPWWPSHGVGGAKPIVDKPKYNRHRQPTYPIGVDAAKQAIYSRLQLATPGPGFMSFPTGAGFDSEFFEGLVSERLVVGRHGKRSWVKSRRRNESIDCTVYSLAAIELLVGHNPGLLSGAAPAPAPRRRVISRGIS